MTTLGRQGGWAIADQVISSGTNFVPALLLARFLGPAGYGAFALAFLAWFSALAVLRAALMQPYTLRAASLDGPDWRDVTGHAAGAVVVAGVVVGGAFALTAMFVRSSTLAHSLFAVAVLAPGLALQEFWRCASFAAQRARTAAANDAFWALGQLVAFAFVLSRGHATAAGCILAWGVGGLLAAGLGVFQLSVAPRIDRAMLRWARASSRIGAWFTAESATWAAGSLAVAVIVAASTGSAGLGLFRTVQNLFGPVQLLTIGAESVFLPYLVRTIDRTATSGIRESQLYAVVMSGSTAAYGVVVLVAAHLVLTEVFGAAFASATVVVFPLLIAFTLDATTSGAELLLKARAKGGRLFVAQLVSTSTRVAAVAVLVSIDGLRGAAWGLVVGSAVAAVVAWAQVVLMNAGNSERRDVRTSGRDQLLQAR